MSKIEWTDKTWNPITGCTKISAGCRNCYAERMARRLAGRYGYPEAPHHFDVTMHRERLGQPFDWRKPRRVFVCSMSDLFHPLIDKEFVFHVFDVMTNDWTCQHIFQVLTKRPRLMLDWFTEYRDYFHLPLLNVWLGVSVENQRAADERIPLLLQTPAAVHFVSVEPLLEPIDFREWTWDGMNRDDHPKYKRYEYPTNAIHWIIAGCESGPGARPMDEDWVRDLRDQCVASGTPFFYKQRIENGNKVSMPELDGRVWDQFPEGIR